MKKAYIIFNFLIIMLVISASILSANEEIKESRSIKDFEASEFFKKQILLNKDNWNLRAGGRNNSYSFKDTENPNSSFGVEFTSLDKKVLNISVHWNGASIHDPAQITPNKIKILTDLAKFWGVGDYATKIIEYVKSQQSKNYSGGSQEAPRDKIGDIIIYCGTTGETLWIGWEWEFIL